MMEQWRPRSRAVATMQGAALGLAALIVSAAATPAGATGETIGGPGGGPYRIACGVGRFVVGLTGRSGSWMDQVAPICVKIDAHGRWTEAPSVRPSVGGSGGVAFTMMCPRDSVVVGFNGYGGEYVFNLGLTCRHDGPDGAEWKTAVPSLVGGSRDLGSTAGGDCGMAAAADGIIGGAGIYVDRFGLSCAGYLVQPDPVPDPPAPPAKKPLDTIILSPVEKKGANSALLKALFHDFAAPTINGAGVDLCVHWGTSCGAPAADEFCRRQGYVASSTYTVQNDAPPTLILGDNAVCNEAGCDRFAMITCR